MSDFVEANVVRYELSDGRWIEIKDELDYGETQQLYGRSTRFSDASNLGKYRVDMFEYNFLKLVLYLVDWDLRDATGKVLEVNEENVRRLKPNRALEISTIIDQHILRKQAEAEGDQGNVSSSGSAKGGKSRSAAG